MIGIAVNGIYRPPDPVRGRALGLKGRVGNPGGFDKATNFGNKYNISAALGKISRGFPSPVPGGAAPHRVRRPTIVIAFDINIC